MPFCVECGKELSYGDKFCSACGKENAEYRPDSGPKTGEYDITITPKIRLYGPHDAKTEIELYIPQLRRTMYLRFPNFFELGQTLRVHGEGLTKPNCEKGDLLVTPTEVEYYDTELTISARLVGAADAVTKIPLYLPHAGKTVQISVPNNMTAGKTLRLKGLGLNAPHGEKGDLYLRFDHIEYEKEQPSVQKKEKTERKTVYEGELHKCPSCGEIINSFVSVCPSCGHEMRGAAATSVVRELSMKLERTSDVLEKEELIRTFYIPNTREDIHEFFILALSQIKIGGTNTDAWMVKLEQAYQKAELSFPGTPDFNHLKPLYEKAQLLNKKNSALSSLKNITKYFQSGYAWALLFLGITIICNLICSIFGRDGFLKFFYNLGDTTYPIALIVAITTFFTRRKKKDD